MSHPGRVIGFAIVSNDGMIADADGVMPDGLKLAADQKLFERGLETVDVVLHGRHSQEQHRRSHLRRRLILTRQVSTIAPDPTNDRALFWNPSGAPLEQALEALAAPEQAVLGVIGGADVFALFLDRFDVFYLSRASNLRLPGGRPVFPGVPGQTPEEVLSRHGLQPGDREMLDTNAGLEMVAWLRSADTA